MGVSPLHELYPGRPMLTSYFYDRSEIPNEDPDGAAKTYESHKQEMMTYANQLENLARAQGGGDIAKIDVHPAVEPDALVDDPHLHDISMIIPTFNEIKSFDPEVVRDENQKDFRVRSIEGFRIDAPKLAGKKQIFGPIREGFEYTATNQKPSSIEKWVVIWLVALVVTLIVCFVIYEFIKRYGSY